MVQEEGQAVLTRDGLSRVVESGDEVDDVVLATPAYRPRGIRLAEPAEAGGKGAGLLRLPTAWYPPTLVISPNVNQLHRDGRLGLDFLSVSSSSQRYTSALKSLAALVPSKTLFVRSSAAREGMSERGKYESGPSAPTLSAVESVVAEYWQQFGAEDNLGFVIQPMLDDKIRGHLSNEYRVSRDTTAWVSDTSVGTQPVTWRVTNSVAAEDAPLECRTVDQIEPVLRRVAKFLSDLPFRHHLEWVWDGDRIWIVQADRVPPRQGPAPGDAWSPRRGETIDPGELAVWKQLDGERLSESTGWLKAEALAQFGAADLPIATVWMLEGTQTIESLANGDHVAGFSDDVELISSGHVVVRTDIRGEEEQVMLPKTDTVSDSSRIEEFIRKTASDLITAGTPSSDIAFLAHRYLRARACAWTLAYPSDPYVEVDSMWGTPDGLGWLPHDSSWVNVDTSEVWRSISGKTDFLDIDEDGEWTYRESPTEWIWRASMSEDQLRTVAAGASRLADVAGCPVLTMWFIGILDGADVECLPWYQSKKIPDDVAQREQVSPAVSRTTVKSASDLEDASAAVARGVKVLKLLPGPDFVRDKEFVKQVVAIAKANDLTVELVGSPLAHPYYLLREAGVAVSCVGQFSQPLTQHNKLVRDNIVELIESNGEVVVSYRAAGLERARLLRLKVVEEAMEVLQSASPEEVTEELADLEEVAEALRVALNIRRDDVRQRRIEKRSKRGGFGEGLVLVSAGRRGRSIGAELDGIFGDELPDQRPWQVQQRGGRVILSALPPVAGEQQTFIVKLGTRNVRVHYRDARIEIEAEDDADEQPGASPTLF